MAAIHQLVEHELAGRWRAWRPIPGMGGCAPRPRKPSPAAVRMIAAMLSVMRTTTEGMHIGTTWRRMMRSGEAPCSRTAAM